jgi:hypothetical protein
MPNTELTVSGRAIVRGTAPVMRASLLESDLDVDQIVERLQYLDAANEALQNCAGAPGIHQRHARRDGALIARSVAAGRCRLRFGKQPLLVGPLAVRLSV